MVLEGDGTSSENQKPVRTLLRAIEALQLGPGLERRINTVLVSSGGLLFLAEYLGIGDWTSEKGRLAPMLVQQIVERVETLLRIVPL